MSNYEKKHTYGSRIFTDQEIHEWPESFKKCSKCKKLRLFEAFGSDAKGLFKLNQVCKPCRSVKAKKDYENVDLKKRMLQRAKSRAELKGLDFSITEEDIDIPESCPVLGIPLEKGTGVATDASPSLDRLRPSKGYVPGNVAVISYKANRIKSDATLTELRKVLEWFESCVAVDGIMTNSGS